MLKVSLTISIIFFVLLILAYLTIFVIGDMEFGAGLEDLNCPGICSDASECYVFNTKRQIDFSGSSGRTWGILSCTRSVRRLAFKICSDNLKTPVVGKPCLASRTFIWMLAARQISFPNLFWTIWKSSCWKTSSYTIGVCFQITRRMLSCVRTMRCRS